MLVSISNLTSYTLLVGYKMVQPSLATSYKVKHMSTLLPRNSIPKYSLKRNENICTHRKKKAYVQKCLEKLYL